MPERTIHVAAPRRGFTLVELSSVMLVIVILAAIAVGLGRAQLTRTEEGAADTTMRSIEGRAVELRTARSLGPVDAVEAAFREAPADIPPEAIVAIDGPTIGDLDGCSVDAVCADADRDVHRIVWLQGEVCRTLLLTDDGAAGPILNAECIDEATGQGGLPVAAEFPAGWRSLTVPDTPTGIVASDDQDHQITVVWSHSGAATYRIHRRTLPSGSWTPVATSSTNGAWVMRPATPGVLYEFAVSAFNGSGESAPSYDNADVDEGQAADTFPTAVDPLTAAGSDTQVVLTWQAPTDTDLDEVSVWRYAGACVGGNGPAPANEPGCGASDADPMVRIGTLPSPTQAQFTDTSVTASATYTYALLLEDAGGNATWSALGGPVQAVDQGTPDRPTGLTAAADGSSIRVSWTPPSDPTATAFRVYRDNPADTDPPVQITQVNRAGDGVHNYVDTGSDIGGLAPGVLYAYTVASVNGAGALSDPAGPVNATVGDTSTLPAPNLQLAVDDSSTSVQLAWAMTTDPRVTRFDIWREVRAADGTVLQAFQPYKTAPAGARRAIDATPVGNATNIYRIRAFDGVNNTAGPWSNTASTDNPDQIAPEPPTGLTAVDGIGQVDLTWVPSVNTIGDAAGYLVTVTSDTDPYYATPRTFDVDGPDTSAWTHDSASYPYSYTYTVATVDLVGNVGDAAGPVSGTALDDGDPAPALLESVDPRPGALRVTFTPSVSVDVAEYRVQATSTHGTVTSPPVTPAEADGGHTLDLGPLTDPPAAWTVTVITVDDAGNTTPSNTITVTPYRGGPLPPPTNFTLVELDSAIQLLWDEPNTDVPTLHYRVVRNGDDEFAAGDNVDEWTDTAVTWGVDYDYELVVTDDFGREATVGPVTGTPDDLTPPEPVTGADGEGWSDAGDHGITATVTGPSVSADVVRYRFTLAKGGSPQGGPQYVTATAPLTVDWSSLVRGDTYTVTIVAEDRAGNLSAPFTMDVVAGDMSGPLAPIIEAVESRDLRALITWAHGDYPDVSAFRIYTDVGGPAGTPTLLTEIPTTGNYDGDTEFLHVALTHGTYTWWVSAVDQSGVESDLVSRTATIDHWRWSSQPVAGGNGLGNSCRDVVTPTSQWRCAVGSNNDTVLDVPTATFTVNGTPHIINWGNGSVYAWNSTAGTTTQVIGRSETPVLAGGAFDQASLHYAHDAATLGNGITLVVGNGWIAEINWTSEQVRVFPQTDLPSRPANPLEGGTPRIWVTADPEQPDRAYLPGRLGNVLEYSTNTHALQDAVQTGIGAARKNLRFVTLDVGDWRGWVGIDTDGVLWHGMNENDPSGRFVWEAKGQVDGTVVASDLPRFRSDPRTQIVATTEALYRVEWNRPIKDPRATVREIIRLGGVEGQPGRANGPNARFASLRDVHITESAGYLTDTLGGVATFDPAEVESDNTINALTWTLATTNGRTNGPVDWSWDAHLGQAVSISPAPSASADNPAVVYVRQDSRQVVLTGPDTTTRTWNISGVPTAVTATRQASGAGTDTYAYPLYVASGNRIYRLSSPAASPWPVATLSTTIVEIAADSTAIWVALDNGHINKVVSGSVAYDQSVATALTGIDVTGDGTTVAVSTPTAVHRIDTTNAMATTTLTPNAGQIRDVSINEHGDVFYSAGTTIRRWFAHGPDVRLIGQADAYGLTGGRNGEAVRIPPVVALTQFGGTDEPGGLYAMTANGFMLAGRPGDTRLPEGPFDLAVSQSGTTLAASWTAGAGMSAYDQLALFTTRQRASGTVRPGERWVSTVAGMAPTATSTSATLPSTDRRHVFVAAFDRWGAYTQTEIVDS